jgi:hypothetical protein
LKSFREGQARISGTEAALSRTAWTPPQTFLWRERGQNRCVEESVHGVQRVPRLTSSILKKVTDEVFESFCSLGLLVDSNRRFNSCLPCHARTSRHMNWYHFGKRCLLWGTTKSDVQFVIRIPLILMERLSLSFLFSTRTPAVHGCLRLGRARHSL